MRITKVTFSISPVMLMLALAKAKTNGVSLTSLTSTGGLTFLTPAYGAAAGNLAMGLPTCKIYNVDSNTVRSNSITLPPLTSGTVSERPVIFSAPQVGAYPRDTSASDWIIAAKDYLANSTNFNARQNDAVTSLAAAVKFAEFRAAVVAAGGEAFFRIVSKGKHSTVSSMLSTELNRHQSCITFEVVIVLPDNKGVEWDLGGSFITYPTSSQDIRVSGRQRPLCIPEDLGAGIYAFGHVNEVSYKAAPGASDLSAVLATVHAAFGGLR